MDLLDSVATDGMQDLGVHLAHVHLPMLDAAGVITWNRRADEVTPGLEFEDVRLLLELLEANHDVLPTGWL